MNSKDVDQFIPKMTDSMLDAAEVIDLPKGKFRAFYPVGRGENVKYPLEVFWEHVSQQQQVELANMSVEDFIVSPVADEKLRSLVEKFALKTKGYLQKGTKALDSAVGLAMLDLGPVALKHPQMRDDVVYFLPRDFRMELRKEEDSE